MKFEPVKYKRFEREPIGHFDAQMTDTGWSRTSYENNTKSVLLSVELTEFIHLVEHFFKECADWQKLQKFAGKYGTEIRNDSGNTLRVINFLGDRMDYTLRIDGTALTILPYRKFNH